MVILGSRSDKIQLLQVSIVNRPCLKDMSLTRMPLILFSLSSLSTSTKMFGYSSFIYAGNLCGNKLSSRFIALSRCPLTIASLNIAWLSSKLKYRSVAGMYGRTNELVRIIKWILCPLAFGRMNSAGKSLLEVRVSTSSSRLKVIFAIADPNSSLVVQY